MSTMASSHYNATLTIENYPFTLDNAPQSIVYNPNYKPTLRNTPEDEELSFAAIGHTAWKLLKKKLSSSTALSSVNTNNFINFTSKLTAPLKQASLTEKFNFSGFAKKTAALFAAAAITLAPATASDIPTMSGAEPSSVNDAGDLYAAVISGNDSQTDTPTTVDLTPAGADRQDSLRLTEQSIPAPEEDRIAVTTKIESAAKITIGTVLNLGKQPSSQTNSKPVTTDAEVSFTESFVNTPPKSTVATQEPFVKEFTGPNGPITLTIHPAKEAPAVAQVFEGSVAVETSEPVYATVVTEENQYPTPITNGNDSSTTQIPEGGKVIDLSHLASTAATGRVLDQNTSAETPVPEKTVIIKGINGNDIKMNFFSEKPDNTVATPQLADGGVDVDLSEISVVNTDTASQDVSFTQKTVTEFPSIVDGSRDKRIALAKAEKQNDTEISSNFEKATKKKDLHCDTVAITEGMTPYEYYEVSEPITLASSEPKTVEVGKDGKNALLSQIVAEQYSYIFNPEGDENWKTKDAFNHPHFWNVLNDFAEYNKIDNINVISNGTVYEVPTIAKLNDAAIAELNKETTATTTYSCSYAQKAPSTNIYLDLAA